MDTSFPKLEEYIGREEQKKSILSYAKQAIEQPRCVGLYFQAEGGLGKTRLLEMLPHIFSQDGLGADYHTIKIKIAQILDLYSFESRNPNVIEQRLIAGLKRHEPDQWYRLPADEVDAAFAEYQQALEEEIRNTGNPEQVPESANRLRRTFVACWNKLANVYPLVIRCDTLETLFNRSAPPEALARAEAAGDITTVIAWLETTLPQLKHTLVLLCGRPVEGADDALVASLQNAGVLDRLTPRQTIQPFSNRENIRAYLEAYGISPSPRDLEYLWLITEGRPLLLTCYAETRRDITAIPPSLPNLPNLSELQSRSEFEDWLIEAILNPMRPPVPPSLNQATLVYSLYFLVYARRGIRPDQLQELFEHHGLRFDRNVIDQLDNLALIKQIGGLLFLHDEIFTMLDKRGKAEDLGLRTITLNYLCSMSRARVQEASDIERPGAMSDSIYYELMRDIRDGYYIYTIYADWLLRERNIAAVLMLSDAFWSTMAGNSHRLQQSSLPYETITRNELVHRAKLLRGLDERAEATEMAEKLYRQFVGEGVIPNDEQAEDGALPANPYLFIDLTLVRAITLGESRPPDYERRSEKLFRRLIDLLESPSLPIEDDDLLKLRREYFLGLAYNYRGFLRRQRQQLAEAVTDTYKAREAYRNYRSSAEKQLNDQINVDLAQVTNNLAFMLALQGEFDEALRYSDQLLGRFGASVSPYRQALFYNTNALIRIRSGELIRAQIPLSAARKAAEESGFKRAQGLVAHTTARLERTMMLRSEVPNPQAEVLFEQASELLAGEPGTLLEVFNDWAGYNRDLAMIYRRSGEYDRANRHEERALELLDQAMMRGAGADLQRADLLESKATVSNNMGRYDDATRWLDDADKLLQTLLPKYGQVVSGKVALQRGYIALKLGQYAESVQKLLVALARAYVFALVHRDQAIFEDLIRQWIRDLLPEDVLPELNSKIKAGALDVRPNDLPYQIPESDEWAAAWKRSKQFISNQLAVRLEV